MPGSMWSLYRLERNRVLAEPHHFRGHDSVLCSLTVRVTQETLRMPLREFILRAGGAEAGVESSSHRTEYAPVGP